VATSADASLLAEQSMPQVALIDLHLRGGETAHGLLDRLHAAGVPVVIISGLSVRPPAGEMVAVLQKPFSGPELLATLYKIVTGRSSSDRPTKSLGA
jgi:hypothetical protein